MDKSPDDLTAFLWGVWNKPGCDPRRKQWLPREAFADCGIPYPSPAFDEWMYRNHMRVADHDKYFVCLRRAEYY